MIFEKEYEKMERIGVMPHRSYYVPFDEKDEIEAFDKILSSPYFDFILEKDEKFSPYTFMNLFDFCETGNKDEILSNIRSDSRIGAKTLEMFQQIFDEEETK